MYVVPKAPKQAQTQKQFEFAIDGKPFSMPSADELIPVADLIELMSLEPGPQNARLMQVFAKHLPEKARPLFKTKAQMIGTLQAWYADGNGVTEGELAASAG